MPDSGGLYLDVRPTGKRVWRMRYKFKGKENILTFGDYQLVTLKEARVKRDDARRTLVDKIDPAVQSKMEQIKASAPVFRDIALEFMAKKQYDYQVSSRKYSHSKLSACDR
jgi:hypothetical protein